MAHLEEELFSMREQLDSANTHVLLMKEKQIQTCMDRDTQVEKLQAVIKQTKINENELVALREQVLEVVCNNYLMI